MYKVYAIITPTMKLQLKLIAVDHNFTHISNCLEASKM